MIHRVSYFRLLTSCIFTHSLIFTLSTYISFVIYSVFSSGEKAQLEVASSSFSIYQRGQAGLGNRNGEASQVLDCRWEDRDQGRRVVEHKTGPLGFDSGGNHLKTGPTKVEALNKLAASRTSVR